MRYINADALYEKFQSLSYDDWNQGVSTTWANAYSEAADMVDDMPTADVASVRHGEWVDKNGGIATCSMCGTRWGVWDVMNYCPNCGAKMDGGDGE